MEKPRPRNVSSQRQEPGRALAQTPAGQTGTGTQTLDVKRKSPKVLHEKVYE